MYTPVHIYIYMYIIRMMREAELAVSLSVRAYANSNKNGDIAMKISIRVTWHLRKVGIVNGQMGSLLTKCR